MRNPSGVVASVVAVAVAVSGCSKNPPKPPPTTTPPPASQKITFNFPIPTACPAGTTVDPNENYTITLGPSFKLTDPDVTKGGHKEGKPNGPPKSHPTKLDIQTDLLSLTNGMAGTVTIILSQKLDFASHPTTSDPTLPQLAFNGADDGATKIFCNPQFGTKSGYPALTFTVLPNAQIPYGSYILGLVAHDKTAGDPDELPVFIDPGVDNNGFDK